MPFHTSLSIVPLSKVCLFNLLFPCSANYLKCFLGWLLSDFICTIRCHNLWVTISSSTLYSLSTLEFSTVFFPILNKMYFLLLLPLNFIVDYVVFSAYFWRTIFCYLKIHQILAPRLYLDPGILKLLSWKLENVLIIEQDYGSPNWWWSTRLSAIYFKWSLFVTMDIYKIKFIRHILSTDDLNSFYLL